MIKGNFLFFYEEVYVANIKRRRSFYMTFHQVSYVLYTKIRFLYGVIDVSSMIQVDQGITFAWSNICVSTRHATKTEKLKIVMAS
jgi:hypothetical protein